MQNVSERYQQRLRDFSRAFQKLEQGLKEAVTELNRDGVIQRFEFTYEQAWKTIRLWLAQKDIQALNAKESFKAALEQGLITDGNLWSRIHENRNLMSHTYDEEEAKKVFTFIKSEGYPALQNLLNTLKST